MRFIMDEFYGIGLTNKTVIFQLIKTKNGDYRIKRGSKIVSIHSIKSVAEEKFEYLRNKLKI